MKKILSFTLGLMALSVVACNDDKTDTEKPVIELTEPAEGDSILIGDPNGMHLEMELSDNEVLGSYKIDIHSAAGHSHNKSAESNAWTFTKNYDDIAGQRNAHIHHHDIKIPEGTPEGEYHIVVYCLDQAGNEDNVSHTVVLSTMASADDDD